MIHTVKIDDTTRNGKILMRELRRYRKGIEFENPVLTGQIPEGYMTGDEFESRVIADITKFYTENGLL